MLEKLKVKKEVGTKALWLYIKKGIPHPIGLAPLTEYQDHLHQLIETKFTHPISMTWKTTTLAHKRNEELLLSYYNDLVNANIYIPGRYGDWIKCTELTINGEIYLNLDIIGQAAWIKPTLAADLGIFIKATDRFYFVGIIRKNEPASGLPAIIGGILNVGRELESPIYTMIREVKEEVNLDLRYSGDINALRVDHDIENIPVSTTIFGKLFPQLQRVQSQIHYITTIPTTEQERNVDGTKRVYTTTAFTVLFDLGMIQADIPHLLQIFKAGDDAAEIVVEDVTEVFLQRDFSAGPHFGLIHHHELFQKMVEFHLLEDKE